MNKIKYIFFVIWIVGLISLVACKNDGQTSSENVNENSEVVSKSNSQEVGKSFNGKWKVISTSVRT